MICEQQLTRIIIMSCAYTLRYKLDDNGSNVCWHRFTWYTPRDSSRILRW